MTTNLPEMSVPHNVVVRTSKKKYHIHVETKNLSFLQTAKDLKMLGIKNNMFFLALYDLDLRYIDPHMPNLPDHLAIKVINECIRNPWYFLRECAIIPEQGGNGIPYQLHRGNLAATFCFLNGFDHYLVLPRQKGKTMSEIAIVNWAFQFGTTNSEIMFINKRQADANNNLDRLKVQRDLLPKYMHFKTIFNEEGKKVEGQNNVQSFSNPATNNKIVTKPSATSVEKAEGLGRGATQPIQYYDEVEFTPHIKTIVEAAGPAFNTASSNAKRNNAAYCRIFTSTPGDLDTQPGQEALQITNETAKWTEVFYDWITEENGREKIEEYIASQSGNGILYIEYSYRQLGDDEEWFKKACRSVLNNPVKIKREILLQRIRGSSESPFESEDLAILQEKQGSVIEEFFIHKLFRYVLYDVIDRSLPYLIGVDVAHGLGKDNTAVTIVHPYTLKTVGEFRSPYIGTHKTHKMLYTLVRKHLPNAILCIERNNVGESILDELRQTDIAHRLYFDDGKDLITIDDKLDAKGFLVKEAARRKLYGVYTQGKSREIMMEILHAHMEEKKETFVGEYVISDVLSLVINKRGKIEAGVGFHDDSIMSYLIALYVYYHGKNLSRFGLVKGRLPGEGEENRGLEFDELVEELPEEMKEDFKSVSIKTEEDYMLKMRMEIERTRREMSQYDAFIKPTNYVENLDDTTEGLGINLGSDFFDGLND